MLGTDLEIDKIKRNREVKVLLVNHFGFSKPKQAYKSLMLLRSNMTAENLAETIRCTDVVRQCAEMIRESLSALDFDLQDRFCDAHDLETASANIKIPTPLLNFFAALYNFDAGSFESASKKLVKAAAEVADDESDCADQGVSEGKCRQVLGLTQNSLLYPPSWEEENTNAYDE